MVSSSARRGFPTGARAAVAGRCGLGELGLGLHSSAQIWDGEKKNDHGNLR